MDIPSTGDVEGELADGDGHAVDAEVAEAEDAGAVGDDGNAGVGATGPVSEDSADGARVVDADKEALGAAVVVGELEAGVADGGRVDERVLVSM